jgi:hypothetical protein
MYSAIECDFWSVDYREQLQAEIAESNAWIDLFGEMERDFQAAALTMTSEDQRNADWAEYRDSIAEGFEG